MEREKPAISMVMRDDFDFELVKTAANSGANIILECTVTDVETDGFGVRLSTTQGQIKAKFLLIADGATGTLARKLGWNESRHIIPALEYEVEVDENVYERFSRTARFDFDLVSDGYAWVFPKREHLSIGVLSMKRGRKDLKSLFQKYLNVLEIQHVNQITRHGYVIPVTPRTDRFVMNRSLLIGDAAGFADPITAEGISNAILSGRLAAEAILEGNLEEETVSTTYEEAVRRLILSQLRHKIHE